MYSAIQEEADNLKNNQKVDYVILLTHVGMNKEEYTSNEILSNVQNIDAVFDGHTHDVYNTSSKDKSNKNIPVTQAGTKLAYIGQLIIKQDGTLLTENIAKVPEPEDQTNAIQINRGGDNR
jgi:2',3'-cyclic-nucleotide 2'-phosphodiesterase (5'-nucleotidase family)